MGARSWRSATVPTCIARPTRSWTLACAYGIEGVRFDDQEVHVPAPSDNAPLLRARSRLIECAPTVGKTLSTTMGALGARFHARRFTPGELRGDVPIGDSERRSRIARPSATSASVTLHDGTA